MSFGAIEAPSITGSGRRRLRKSPLLPPSPPRPRTAVRQIKVTGAVLLASKPAINRARNKIRPLSLTLCRALRGTYASPFDTGFWRETM